MADKWPRGWAENCTHSHLCANSTVHKARSQHLARQLRSRSYGTRDRCTASNARQCCQVTPRPCLLVMHVRRAAVPRGGGEDQGGGGAARRDHRQPDSGGAAHQVRPCSVRYTSEQPSRYTACPAHVASVDGNTRCIRQHMFSCAVHGRLRQTEKHLTSSTGTS